MRKALFLCAATMIVAMMIARCNKSSPTGPNTTPPTPIYGITMVTIPGGTFQMGSSSSSYDSVEAPPPHKVTLGAFSMSKTLITQAQYSAVLDTNHQYSDTGIAWPVQSVSWYNAALFCNKLSKIKGRDTVYSYSGAISYSVVIDYTKNGYRLPTQEEFEYAYRAGTTTDYYWGRNYPTTTHEDTLAIDSNAVWQHNSPNGPQPVGSKKPNAWGLYDMSGNLFEWCNDSYWTSSKALRGGSYLSGSAKQLQAAYIIQDFPDDNYDEYHIGIGFRVVCGVR
jgi:formylglycine-generating enzyme required for sulfatase activity